MHQWPASCCTARQHRAHWRGEHSIHTITARLPHAARLGGRLLAASALGTLSGPYADIGLRLDPQLALGLSAAALFVPALAIVLVAPATRHVLAAGLAILLLMVACAAVARLIAEASLFDLSPLVAAPWLALPMYPVAAGFVCGGATPTGRARGRGAWVGLAAGLRVGVHHLLFAAHDGAFAASGPDGTLGQPLVILLLVLYTAEVPAILLGGVVGGALRARLGRAPTRAPEPRPMPGTAEPQANTTATPEPPEPSVA
jgi:hypothetical protein